MTTYYFVATRKLYQLIINTLVSLLYSSGSLDQDVCSSGTVLDLEQPGDYSRASCELSYLEITRQFPSIPRTMDLGHDETDLCSSSIYGDVILPATNQLLLRPSFLN